MSAITNLWGQFVQRRLWPVAILLIAALAAVPLALAQEPDPAVPAPAVAAGDSTESALAVQPIVTQATAADRGRRRKVLGARKNPFGLPQTEEAGSAAAPNSDGATTAQDPVIPTPAGTSPSPSSGGSPSPSTGGSVTPPASDPTPEPAPKTYAMHELTVRFGSDDAMRRMNVERLDAVPVGEEPLVVYLGVADGGKSAVFLVDSSVKAEGDGECVPDPSTCEQVHVREGETEFFDIVGENGETVAAYRLDLLKIHQGTNASQAKARQASKAVRRALRGITLGALQDRPHSTPGPTRVRSGAARTADIGLPLP